MGWAGFKELYKKKDKLNIVLLLRDSEKNRKKFANYLNDPSVKIVWGDLKKYDDVLKCVEGSDYVLHVGEWSRLRLTIIRQRPFRPTPPLLRT